ncbi:uncharacterized protein LOC100376511 [Saccoglossus kowalevskii]|uniref:Uncharacterized protein LOC100376511 n=1 Tax=Saccoglossus kowalevskii TaxID=10224 RepID=A0ABM0GMX2_SACKO|nr:PREDICTED: uncharacterized protein LOC100376511 [Saccoglossus kowalevskii]
MAHASNDDFSGYRQRITPEYIEKQKKRLLELKEEIRTKPDESKDNLIKLLPTLMELGIDNGGMSYQMVDERRSRLDSYQTTLNEIDGFPLPDFNDRERRETYCESVSKWFTKKYKNIKQLFFGGNMTAEDSEDVYNEVWNKLQREEVQSALEYLKTQVRDSRQKYLKLAITSQARSCFLAFGMFLFEMYTTHEAIGDLHNKLTGRVDQRITDVKKEIEELIKDTKQCSDNFKKTGKPSIPFDSLIGDYNRVKQKIEQLARDLLGMQSEMKQGRMKHGFGAAVNGMETYNAYQQAKMSMEYLPGWWKVLAVAIPIARGIMTMGHGISAVQCHQALQAIAERLDETDKLKQLLEDGMKILDELLDNALLKCT